MRSFDLPTCFRKNILLCFIYLGCLSLYSLPWLLYMLLLLLSWWTPAIIIRCCVTMTKTSTAQHTHTRAHPHQHLLRGTLDSPECWHRRRMRTPRQWNFGRCPQQQWWKLLWTQSLLESKSAQPPTDDNSVVQLPSSVWLNLGLADNTDPQPSFSNL